MANDNSALAETTIDEEIVAYLDGELQPEDAARVELRLSKDAAYRARLGQLQQAWDMLDNLRRTEADDDFVQSTVAMVAVQADEEAKTQAIRAQRRRNFVWLALSAVVLLAATMSFAVVHRISNRDNRRLVRDLPVIEHVDEYSNIGSFEFLKELERQNLFAAEVDDGT
jgi:anti-sigma factor RsiW